MSLRGYSGPVRIIRPPGQDIPQRAALARPDAEDHRLEQDLQAAMDQGGFLLHYQPRVSLATREPVGAEALMRWAHRKRGMISPEVFIPVAERCGLITPMGGWAMAAACAEAATWPAATVVSVNVSARQIGDGVLQQQVEAALASSRLPPERLELELTESMLVDVGVETLFTLSAVRDLGVGIALDDFGTGYASLAALKRLPLTAMKLDRSLIRGVPHRREDAAIARAVVETGRALGLTIVVEGIETEAQREFLLGLGCAEGQSYLFGRPMPAGRLREVLGAGRQA